MSLVMHVLPSSMLNDAALTVLEPQLHAIFSNQHSMARLTSSRMATATAYDGMADRCGQSKTLFLASTMKPGLVDITLC